MVSDIEQLRLATRRRMLAPKSYLLWLIGGNGVGQACGGKCATPKKPTALPARLPAPTAARTLPKVMTNPCSPGSDANGVRN